MKNKLYLFCFLLVGLFAKSQDGYMSGYIINYKGDTVRGKIKDRKEPNNKISWQKIGFINEKGEKDKYTADDIRGYCKTGSSKYQSLVLGVEGNKRFAQILESGSIILFSYSLGLSQKAVPDYLLQKANDVNSLMQWRESDYKKTAPYFFRDDKELIKSIEDEALKHQDIQKIVQQFNEWKAKQ